MKNNLKNQNKNSIKIKTKMIALVKTIILIIIVKIQNKINKNKKYKMIFLLKKRIQKSVICLKVLKTVLEFHKNNNRNKMKILQICKQNKIQIVKANKKKYSNNKN